MISKNPKPVFTTIKPDFKCKFSVKNIPFSLLANGRDVYTCAMRKEVSIECDGMKEDRDTCPYWK